MEQNSRGSAAETSAAMNTPDTAPDTTLSAEDALRDCDECMGACYGPPDHEGMTRRAVRKMNENHAALVARMERAEATIKRVRELHRPCRIYEEGEQTEECASGHDHSEGRPICATIKALATDAEILAHPTVVAAIAECAATIARLTDEVRQAVAWADFFRAETSDKPEQPAPQIAMHTEDSEGR